MRERAILDVPQTRSVWIYSALEDFGKERARDFVLVLISAFLSPHSGASRRAETCAGMLIVTGSPSSKRSPDSQPAAAPSRKAPRLEPSTASAALPAPQIRKPKLAAVFRKAHERDPEPLRAAESAFIDTQFEVEDAASCTCTRCALIRAGTKLTVLLHRPRCTPPP